MGLRDRDYTQSDYSYEEKRRPRRTGGRSVVGTLIFINIALWFANGLFFTNKNIPNHFGYLTDWLLLRVGDISLTTSYKFLTYGFAHSPHDWMHIFFNMFALLMFGYGMMLGIGPNGFGFMRGENVEDRLGRLEFTAFYFLTIIIAGVVFALINYEASKEAIEAGKTGAGVLGASGGVCGVVILFAWLYPKKMLLFMGIVPMPMWAIGLLIVFLDALGAAGSLGGGIAYSAHLAGAACGTLYYFLFLKRGMKLTGWIESSPQRKPRLKIHTPEDTPPHAPLADDEFNRLLDEVLKRYGEVGESGLTPEEREFLQRASRRFAEKHRK